jgi:hypothetical protein
MLQVLVAENSVVGFFSPTLRDTQSINRKEHWLAIKASVIEVTNHIISWLRPFTFQRFQETSTTRASFQPIHAFRCSNRYQYNKMATRYAALFVEMFPPSQIRPRGCIIVYDIAFLKIFTYRCFKSLLPICLQPRKQCKNYRTLHLGGLILEY